MKNIFVLVISWVKAIEFDEVEFLMVYFFLRTSDLLSTYLCMSKYGKWEEIEAAPLSKFLIKSFGWDNFTAINWVLSIFIGLMFAFFWNKRVVKTSGMAFLFVQFLIVVSNTLIFIFI
jgi:hypothetical protein